MYSIAPAAASQDARLEDLTKVYADALREDGYVVIPDLTDPVIMRQMDEQLASRFESTQFCEGSFYGSATKRFGRLLTCTDHGAALVQNQLILAITAEILQPWCDVFQLNLTQAVEIHPNSPEQVPHRDQDMWQGPKGEVEYLVNVMWPTNRYTADNGATVVWPGSHRQQQEIILPAHSAIAAEMEPGSALMFLGSTLHGGGRNSTNEIRRGLIISYSLGWLKPYEAQWLAYPPEIARTFSPELAALVGYQQHRPNLGNFEGRCPSILLQGKLPDHLYAIDALRSDQEALIAAYRSGNIDEALAELRREAA